MRELVVASMVLVMTGCRTQQDQLDHLRAEVTRVTGCGDADVKVFANPYPATACGGREYICESVRLREFTYETQCTETAASKESVMQQVALERVAMESECSRDKIQLEESSNWTAGTERAYRFNACGAKYVCTAANGRVECKAKAPPTSAPSQ